MATRKKKTTTKKKAVRKKNVLRVRGKPYEPKILPAAEAVAKALGSKAWISGKRTHRGAVSEVIPFGIDAIDRYVLGIGGLAVGRASEMYSPEGTGKTSLMLKALAGAQREGGLAILAETEAALDLDWASEVHGVDLDKLVLIEPDCLDGEDGATELIIKAVQSIPPGVGPNLVALDSIAATPTLREIEDGLTGKDKVAERAKHLSKACRRFATLLKKHRVHLMFINQVRENIGVMFGDQYTTPGGHAVKFLASVRLQLLGGKAYKNPGGEHLGKDITVLAAKNRHHPPWRKCRVRLDYATGWDNEWSTMWLAKEKELIEPRAKGAKAYALALEKLGWPLPEPEL